LATDKETEPPDDIKDILLCISVCHLFFLGPVAERED